MNALAIKVGAILVGCAGLLFVGFHFGSLSSDAKLAEYKTAVEAQRAAQLTGVADVYRNQLIAADAEHARMEGVIDDLQKTLATPDPAVAGLAQRLRVAESSAASTSRCVMPEARAVADGIEGTGRVSGSDQNAERLRRLTQAAFDAAARDAARLNAAVKLAP